MMMRLMSQVLGVTVMAAALLPAAASVGQTASGFGQTASGFGQTASAAAETLPGLGTAAHVIIPQSRAFPLRRPAAGVPAMPAGGIKIESIRAAVHIREHTARTTLDIAISNTGRRDDQAVLVLPVPDGAVVSAFAFDGPGSEPTAEILPKDEARRLYDSIVARVLDPALLEFAGYSLIRSSVFPVPAGGTQRIRLTYENILGGDGNRVDYVLPRSESLAARRPWDVTVEIESAHPISTVYSPSHEIDRERLGPGRFALRVATAAQLEPGSFRLSYLLDRGGVSASLFAYPDPEVGGGYFLLMAGLPADADKATGRVDREVTVVIDRSGSMAGEKLEQVRAAATQVIEGLDADEAFNIIDYASAVSTFAAAPVRKTPENIEAARRYLAGIRPAGGTNIHDALLEALRQPTIDGTLPLVLFLTDGLPTIGRTSELDIRGMVEAGNAHGRRIFTFGVGEDVNVPLLDRVAESTRATATYVLPDEDVELKVAQVYRRLYGPVLSEPTLRTTDSSGAVTTRLVQELIPRRLPDLFAGDQLILLGQYREEGAVTF